VSHLALVIDIRASPNLKINRKYRTTVYLPLSCFTTACRCHTRASLAKLSRSPKGRAPQFKKPGIRFL